MHTCRPALQCGRGEGHAPVALTASSVIRVSVTGSTAASAAWRRTGCASEALSTAMPASPVPASPHRGATARSGATTHACPTAPPRLRVTPTSGSGCPTTPPRTCAAIDRAPRRWHFARTTRTTGAIRRRTTPITPPSDEILKRGDRFRFRGCARPSNTTCFFRTCRRQCRAERPTPRQSYHTTIYSCSITWSTN